MAFDIKSMCRLCASVKSEMKNFFDVIDTEFVLGEIVNKYLKIMVSEDDMLPSIICTDCIDILKKFNTYAKECERIQEFFQKLLCQNSDSAKPIKAESELNKELLVEDFFLELGNQPITYDQVKEENGSGSGDNENDFKCDSPYMDPGSDIVIKKLTKLRSKKRKKKFKTFVTKRKSSQQSSSEDEDTPATSGKESFLKDFIRFICDKCQQPCVNWCRLKVHTEKEHESKAMVKCKCGLILRSKTAIYRHVAAHNDPTVYKCDQCTKVTKTQAALDKHKIRHIPKPNRKYECEHCDRVFYARENLKSHTRIHIPREQRYIFPCDVCGAKFTTRSAVSGHKRAVHEKLKRFVCDLCGYACGTRGELVQHRAIHSDAKEFHCKLCPKSFKTCSNLKAHMDTHSITSYPCPHCSKVLNSRRTLRKHLLVHEDISPHQCSFCGKTFKRKQTLTVHLTMHTGAKPVQCPWCPERFAYNSTCRTHKQRTHPELYAQAVREREEAAKNESLLQNTISLTSESSKQSQDFTLKQKETAVLKVMSIQPLPKTEVLEDSKNNLAFPSYQELEKISIL